MTAQQAYDMLGIDASLDVPTANQELQDFQPPSLSRVSSAIVAALALMPPVDQRRQFDAELVLPASGRSFPRFGIVMRMVRQMNDAYPMPWTLISAKVADDWGERTGVDLIYYGGHPRE